MINDMEIAGSSIEPGYALLPEYHNRGYGTEMLRGMIDYLLAHGFTRIITGAFEEKWASIRIMEKCGMQRMEQRNTVKYRDRQYACVYYFTEA